MFAATKVLHAGHVLTAKVLTGKAIISASVLASTVATGYVVKSGVPPEYVSGAAVLIDAATLADASHIGTEPTAGSGAEAAAADARMQIDPAVALLVVPGHRMTWKEKARYDAQNKAATRVAKQ